MNYREEKRLEFDRAVMKNIAKAVCRFYNLRPSILFSPTKKKQIVTARHMFHFISHKKFLIPSGIVGTFSGRDHATVLHSAKQISDWSDTDKDIKYDLENILKLYDKPTKGSMLKMVFKQFASDVFKIIKFQMT